MENSFALLGTEPLQLDAAAPLRDMYTLSPFVWKSPDGFDLLVRAVNRSQVASEKVARIYHGVSSDGINYAMDARPVLAPGPDELDRDGCEDPTLALSDGHFYVYYTGWNQTKLRGELLWATGRDIHQLEKRGVALASTAAVTNPKEATIVPVGDGTWRLFFEYARDGASRIGVATSQSVSGPWTVLADPFGARPDAWDNWHLSTGPILQSNPERPVMFYNGAAQGAKWRIGWIAFDATFENVVARCGEPLIVPHGLEAGDTDIAFAASCTFSGTERCDIFYSIADKQMYRAAVARTKE
ncbi:MAG: hypothetical protein GIW95_04215 [Candidatus Eremiobacteraeota bacterium]|nr:hypothetical protein [Candidatus Eremiobacteraeota bacterium]